MYGRVKDITSLALVPNFGELLKGVTPTRNEGLVLLGSKMQTTKIESGSLYGYPITHVYVHQIQ